MAILIRWQQGSNVPLFCEVMQPESVLKRSEDAMHPAHICFFFFIVFSVHLEACLLQADA